MFMFRFTLNECYVSGLFKCTYLYVLVCYERDFMTSLSNDNQADIIEALNSTSRYYDDLLYIDNHYLEGMINLIYTPELKLNKTNTSDTEAPFLDSHISIAYGFGSSKTFMINGMALILIL